MMLYDYDYDGYDYAHSINLSNAVLTCPLSALSRRIWGVFAKKEYNSETLKYSFDNMKYTTILVYLQKSIIVFTLDAVSFTCTFTIGIKRKFKAD